MFWNSSLLKTVRAYWSKCRVVIIIIIYIAQIPYWNVQMLITIKRKDYVMIIMGVGVRVGETVVSNVFIKWVLYAHDQTGEIQNGRRKTLTFVKFKFTFVHGKKTFRNSPKIVIYHINASFRYLAIIISHVVVDYFYSLSSYWNLWLLEM